MVSSLSPFTELSMSCGEPLIRSVSTSTSQRVPWGRGSFLPVSSPETNRRLTVAADSPKIRDASVTVSSALAKLTSEGHGPP